MVSIRFQRWHGIVVSTLGCGPEYLGSNLAKVRFLTPPNISLWVYDPGGGLVKKYSLNEITGYKAAAGKVY